MNSDDRRHEDPPAHVLIIDDDRMSQMVLSRNLRQVGYVVDAANDGPEGLEKLRAKAYDLVILDFLMPEMDGYEVLAKISEDERLKAVPVVVVSGIDDTTNAATLVEAGAADYLTKPIDSGLLRARASRCIEAKRMREREQRLYAEIEANLAKLRESERLRESLTHMIVHDLRTPLTSMLTSVKTVTELGATLTEEKRARLLELALRGGSTLVGMINDLLDIAKLEAGGGILAREEGAVAPVIARAKDQVAALAEHAGIELGVTCADTVIATFDPAKVERVLVNLLGNAVKATDAGGSVRVEVTAEDDGRVVMVVRDTGAGIPAEHLEHIFDKFYRVDVGRKGTASSGLGLTFCKLVIEAHGGSIAATSTVGQGTTIRFTLPR